jgi:hypothetical protein
MLLRPLRHLRRNVVAYCALAVAVAAGGGYAIAASNTTTIHGCVGNRTHVLYIQKRCNRGQRALVWSKGIPARAPVTAWAAVNAVGFTGAGSRGISVQHTGTGTYDVTATLRECTQVTDAPIVTVGTAILPGSNPPGQFPVAWEVHSGNGPNRFTVFTGIVISGSFTPTDEAFNVEVPCS